MGAHQRNKGKAGEREIVRMLRDRGFHAYRGAPAQAASSSCLADVEVDATIAGVRPWLEIKRGKSPRIMAAFRQATADAEAYPWPREPVAITRADRGQWMITMRLSTAMDAGLLQSMRGLELEQEEQPCEQ